MFLSIQNNRSGEDLVLRRLAPNEKLDLRAHVRKWVEEYFGDCEEPQTASFSEPGSWIPNGCGEYQAEIRETKAPGAVCWSSEPFYVVAQDAAIAA